MDSETGPQCESKKSFSSRQRLNLALRFYATGSFQEAIDDTDGASQATMSRIITRVSEVLASHSKDVIWFTVDDEILKKS